MRLVRTLRLITALAMSSMQTPPAWAGESPVVDRSKPSPATGVGRDQISQIPSGRNFMDLITAAPQVAATKDAPRDSANWDHVPGGQYALDRTVEDLSVIRGGALAEYGHYRPGEVINAIRKSGGNPAFADRYAHALNSREWPGESLGYGGTLIGVGRVGKQPTTVVYSPEGVPRYSFNNRTLKDDKRNVLNYLDNMCNLMTRGDYIAGKLTVSDLNSGKVSAGKITAGDTKYDYYEGSGPGPKISFTNALRQIIAQAPQSERRVDDWDIPGGYKFTPQLSYGFGSSYKGDYGLMRGMGVSDTYTGGGMTQIDPPAGGLRQDSGTVTDADVDRGLGKLNQAQRDALDQMGLTPRQPGTTTTGGASNTRTATTPGGSNTQTTTTPPAGGQGQQGQSAQTTDAPVESVLDDIGPDPTAPLHANPEGEPKVTTQGDGTVVRTFPDGTTERIAQNGHTFVRYADNATYERHPDGTTIDRAPDGSTTTRDKDGKVTGRTGPTVIDLDRKIERAAGGPFGGPLPPKEAKSTSGTQDKSAPKTQDKSAPKSVKTSKDASDKTVSGAQNSKASMVKEQYAATTVPASMSRRIAEVPAGMTPAPRVTSASTTDASGNTTTIARQPDGSVQRTVTDRRGKVLEQGPVTQPEPTRVAPREGVTRASATDADGRTVTIEKKDGVTTRTVTDRNGAILERGIVDAPEPTKVPPRTPGVTRASATDANGTTTTIEKFPDGSSTLTVTDANGKVIQQGPLVAPPPTTAPPRDRTTSASMTDANGTTTTITRNPDGSATRTVTGPDGKVISRGPVEQPKPTTARPRERITSASATDEHGNTTTVTRHPDGTATRTVTDRAGKVLASGPVTAPPPSTPRPRDRATSVSTRNPDGTTTTIAKQPDGSTVRTVTDRDGNVVSRAPVEPPPVTKVPPRQPGSTTASTTYPNGNTLTIERQPDGTVTRTITDASGRVIERGTVPPLEPTKPGKKEPAAPFVSTTDASGNTVMIQRQPNGTMTQTVTAPDGTVISQGPIQPPPVTTAPPRTPGFTSASATTEDGRTISVVRQPDGTTTRTVTGPDGKVLEQTTTGGPAPAPQPPAQPEQPPLDPMDPATFGLDFAESPGGVSVGPDGKPEFAPPLPKPQDTGPRYDAQGFRQSEGVSVPAVTPGTGAWTAGAAHSPLSTIGPSIGYPSWWDTYYETSDHLPVKSDFQATPQAAAPNYLDEFTLGAEYEVLKDLRVGLSGQYRRLGEVIDEVATDGATDYVLGSPGTFRGGFNYHVPGWMPYYGTNPRQPEAGFNVGGTNYSNFGTYRDGYRGQTLRDLLVGGADRVQYFTPRLEGFQSGLSYTPGAQPQTTTPSTGGGQSYSPGHRHTFPNFSMPGSWTPEEVIVLPWGCSGREKENFLDDLAEFWNGRPVTWAMAYQGERLIFFDDQADVAPNDPLYDVGEAARDKAESRQKSAEVRKTRGQPDLSMARPTGGGGTMSDVALRGPSHGDKKGPKAQDQWGLRAAGFTPSSQPGSAWAVEAGETPNTVVAIIDSGLDLSHPDGPANLWTNPGEVPDNGQDDDGNGYVDDVHGWNFLNENHDLRDSRGHGTLVAGIIAAKRNNGQGIAGINPGARIMVLKVSDATNKANSLNVYRALRYAAQHGARVINISLGQTGRSRIVQLAINYAHARGAVVVVAAGNQASDTQAHTPANARRALTVAAYGMNGERSAISNAGPNLAVTAPGQEIYSLHSKDAEWPGAAMERERLYRTATGTSFAAPMVAATASLILAKNPRLPAVVVEDLLINSAAPVEGDGWNPATGAGRLDAGKALTFDASRLITILPEEVVVQRNKKKVAAVELYGTVRGVFTSYQLELGEGRSPSGWKPLGGPREDAAAHELLCRIPADELKGSNDWVVRITAVGAKGQRRVAHVPVSL